MSVNTNGGTGAMKVLDPTWEEYTIESPTGDFPLKIILKQRWYENGVKYYYWMNGLFDDSTPLEEVVTTIREDLVDVATA